MEGHIFVRGEIPRGYAAEFEKKLNALSNATELVLHINSNGGSVYDGYTMYHLLKSAGKPITTIIEGEAQSMATFIALAGNRIIARNPSRIMIHEPSQGLQGTADALQGGADELRKISGEMAEAYATKFKKSVEEIRAMMKKETMLTAYEAQAAGYVDEVKDTLKTVAIGKTMKEEMEGEKTILEQVQAEFAALKKLFSPKAEGAPSPKAIDVNLADGKVLKVDGESIQAGAKASIDGQPANGVYALQDGSKITCEGGVIKEVSPAMSTEQKQIADLQAQLTQANQALEASKAATQTATQIQAQEKIAKALGDLQEKIAKIGKKPAGDQSKPYEGGVPNRVAVARGDGQSEMMRDATMTFLAANFPWLEQQHHYPDGFFAQYKPGGPKAVSIVEPSFNFTYPGILTTDLFYKPTMETPAIADMVTIDQSISFQKQYNLVAALDKILKPYGGCGASPNSNRALITNTTLRTKEFRMYEGWCKDDFTQQLTGVYNNLAQEWLKTGEKSFDPAGTPIDQVIMTQLVDALRRDVFRRFSFGAGNSSSADYNQIDGLWDRLIDSSSGGQGNYCVYRSNSGISGVAALGTGNLAAGAALTQFQEAFVRAPYLLKQFINSGKAATLWVTDSLWQNYYDSLVGNGSVSANQYQALRDGIQTLTYKGIAVKAVPFWDFDLANNSTNPLAATTRHLGLLTVKENHIFGVENGADLNKIDSWFEKKDDKRYYRADMKLGYQFLHCDLQVIFF